MRAHVMLPALVGALMLFGCSGGGGGDPSLGGTPREFSRTDSAVTVAPSGIGRYTASQVVTISNDDANAAQAVVSLSNVSGSLASSATSNDYQIQVTLTADGASEQEARATLATMTVAHRDAVGGSTLYLNNEVRYAQYSGANMRSATVTAALPASPDYRLYQHMVSGAVSSSGLGGSEAHLDSTSGAATLSGTWDDAVVDSTSGIVTVSGDIANLWASSTSGAIQVTLACARDTRAMLDGTSAGIDATVTQSAGAGFDLEGHSTSGAVAIAVAGTTPVGTQTPNDAHYRSTNYASASPRIDISAHTTSGGITIHD